MTHRIRVVRGSTLFGGRQVALHLWWTGRCSTFALLCGVGVSWVVEAKLATLSEIEAAVVTRLPSMLESRIYVPLIGVELPLAVHFDAKRSTVSERQLVALNHLLALGPDRLGELRGPLHDSWDDHDAWLDRDLTPDQALETAAAASLLLHDQDSELADWAVLRFDVPWDPEHGVGIYFDGSRWEWCV